MRRACACIEDLEPRRMLTAAVTLLSDSFSTMDKRNWYIPTWRGDGDGTYYGRTQTRCSQNASLPRVVKGAARLVLDTYNPTELGSFYGTELISKKTLKVAAENVLSVRIRAKLNTAIPRGIVGGLFLYKLKPDGVNHDEVDTELLSNQVVAKTNKVHTNVFANQPLGEGSPALVALPKPGRLTSYHTYEMRCSPGQYVKFYVDGKIRRTETATVPSGPFQVHLNIWAPASDWKDAYSAAIQPANTPKANRQYSMDVDSVIVRTWKAPAVTPPSNVLPGQPGVQITKVPSLGSMGYAEGQVTGVNPADYAGVAVMIKVGSGYWTKPYWASPITSVLADGTWKANITTGGSDADATEIRAYLIPKNTAVPILSGESTLPDSLSSLLHATVIRQ